MRIKKTKFRGLVILNGVRHQDQRGYLRELVIEKLIKKKFKFQITSLSKKNVLRGLHLQVHKPQEKFLTVLKGKILDVAVDLRRSSKTFGKHFKIILSEKKSNHLLIPKGFAHGFLSLEKESIVLYNCSTYRYKKGERSIIWNDKDLKIRWGIKNPVVSKKDQKGLTLKEFIK